MPNYQQQGKLSWLMKWRFCFIHCLTLHGLSVASLSLSDAACKACLTAQCTVPVCEALCTTLSRTVPHSMVHRASQSAGVGCLPVAVVLLVPNLFLGSNLYIWVKQAAKVTLQSAVEPLSLQGLQSIKNMFSVFDCCRWRVRQAAQAMWQLVVALMWHKICSLNPASRTCFSFLTAAGGG